MYLVDSLHRECLCASLATISTVGCQTEHVVRHGTINLDGVVTVV